MAAFRALAIFDVCVVVIFGLLFFLNPLVVCIMVPVGFGLAVINVVWLILAAVYESASRPNTRSEAAIITYVRQAEAQRHEPGPGRRSLASERLDGGRDPEGPQGTRFVAED